MNEEVWGSEVVVSGGVVVLVVELVDVVLVGLSSVASPPGQPAALSVRTPATAIRDDTPQILESRPWPEMLLVTVMPTPLEGLVALPSQSFRLHLRCPRMGEVRTRVSTAYLGV
ncbi:MAG: hypothetical protein WCA30_15055 [Dermatophilaceae bacterium]